MVVNEAVWRTSPHQKRLGEKIWMGENCTTNLGGTQNKSGTLFITPKGYE